LGLLKIRYCQAEFAAARVRILQHPKQQAGNALTANGCWHLFRVKIKLNGVETIFRTPKIYSFKIVIFARVKM
jgi:hypothetical protein